MKFLTEIFLSKPNLNAVFTFADVLRYKQEFYDFTVVKLKRTVLKHTHGVISTHIPLTDVVSSQQTFLIHSASLESNYKIK